MRGIGLAANNARKTHCKNGHPFDEHNAHIYRNRARICRACRAAYSNRQYHAKRERMKAVSLLLAGGVAVELLVDVDAVMGVTARREDG